MSLIAELKKRLSAEWKKKKWTNKKKKIKGPRDYNEIKKIQNEINERKKR